jgi:hypothetical protein
MFNCIIWKNNLVAFTAKGLSYDEFKSGGLHEKHAVATWGPSQHSIKDRGKPSKPVSRWPVAGPSGYTLTVILKPEVNLNNMMHYVQIQFLPHREHTASPLPKQLVTVAVYCENRTKHIYRECGK